jgi:ubiquinone/menaquinone biosynthesis C-methylase UbiE
LGDEVDINVDLEEEKIPFEDDSFDSVLCLDVLEHLENIHEIFDELCRVSKEHVIITLPNPYADFLNYLKYRNYYENQHLKFYGLPLEKPEDRHKWFFSTEEAEMFVRYRANKNNMEVIQIDFKETKIGTLERVILKLRLFDSLQWIGNRNLYAGTLWAVLKKARGK